MLDQLRWRRLFRAYGLASVAKSGFDDKRSTELVFRPKTSTKNDVSTIPSTFGRRFETWRPGGGGRRRSRAAAAATQIVGGHALHQNGNERPDARRLERLGGMVDNPSELVTRHVVAEAHVQPINDTCELFHPGEIMSCEGNEEVNDG
jgi:hypothetical protein